MAGVRKEDYNHLREEFRLLIVPLIRQSRIDNPADLISYCAEYFQNLFDEREKLAEQSKTKKRMDEKEKDIGEQSLPPSIGGQRDEMYGVKEVPQLNSRSHLQGSSSLSILNQGEDSGRVSLRETSSWSSSPSFPVPSRMWNVAYDVADVMSYIGDQLNPEGVVNKDDPDFVKERNGILGRDDEKKEQNKVSNTTNPTYLSTDSFNESTMDDNDACLPSAPPLGEDIHHEMCPLMDEASSSTCFLSPPFNRKKWKIEENIENLQIKSKSPETSSDESDDTDNSYNLLEEESMVPLTTCVKRTTFNSSFGFIPHLGEIGGQQEEIRARVKEEKIAVPNSTDEIGVLVKSVTEMLQELIKGLSACRLHLDKTLKVFQKLNDTAEKSHEQMHPTSREKRPITALSTRAEQKEDIKSSKEVKGREAAHNSVNGRTEQKHVGNKRPNVSDKTSSKNHDPWKINSFATNGYSVKRKIANFQKAATVLNDSKIMDEDSPQILREREYNSNDMEGNDMRKNEDSQDKEDSEDMHNSKGSVANDGIVNAGFCMNDDTPLREPVERKSFSPKKHKHDALQRSYFETRYRSSHPRCPNKGPFNRFCSGASTRHNRCISRPVRPTPSVAPATRLSDMGEGGDAPRFYQRQRCVATETEPERVSEFMTLRNPTGLDSAGSEGENSAESTVEGRNKNSNDKGSSCGLTSLLENVEEKRNEVKSLEVAKETISEPGLASGIEDPGLCQKDDEINQERKDNLNAVKKKSSLNPCAECFNPSWSNVVKKVETQTPSTTEKKISSDKDGKFQNSNSQLFDSSCQSEWASEAVDDNAGSARQLLLNLNGMQDNVLNTTSDSLNLNGTDVQEVDLFAGEEIHFSNLDLQPMGFPIYENGTSGEGANNITSSSLIEEDAKNDRQKELRRICSETIKKMAEGDQILKEKSLNVTDQRADENLPSKDEPGMVSACGDFIVPENSEVARTSVEYIDDLQDNIEALNVESVNVGDVENMEIPLLATQHFYSNTLHHEFDELNFSSDSSELSDAELSDENDGSFS